MSKTYATYLELECGAGYGCNRAATDLKEDWAENWKGQTEADKYRASLVCGVHRGAAKRAAKAGRWMRASAEPTFLALSTRADLVDIILADRKQQHDAAVVRANEQRAENDLRVEAQYAEAWVERSTEPEYAITRGSERQSYNDEFRDGYLVSPNGNTSSWDSVGIDVEQSGRNPANVAIRTNRRMSPDYARAVAKALILAANLADERDITNGPA